MKTAQLKLVVLGITIIALLALATKQADAAAQRGAPERALGHLRKLLTQSATPDRGIQRANTNMAHMNGGGRSGGGGGGGGASGATFGTGSVSSNAASTPSSPEYGTTTDTTTAVLRQLCGTTSAGAVTLPECSGRH